MLRNRYNEIDIVKAMDLGFVSDDNYDENNDWDHCQVYVLDELTDEDRKELINEVDFGLIKEGNIYRLEDGQGSNLGDIESEEFESLDEIIDRLYSYWSDYEICILSRDDFELIRKENKSHDKGTCGRCGRPLRSKESIARGYGTHCYKKVETEKAKKEAEENAPIIESLSEGHSIDRTIGPRRVTSDETLIAKERDPSKIQEIISSSLRSKPEAGHVYRELKPEEIISGDKYLIDIETGRIIHQDWIQFEGDKVINIGKEFPAERFEMIKGRDLIAEIKKTA